MKKSNKKVIVLAVILVCTLGVGITAGVLTGKYVTEKKEKAALNTEKKDSASVAESETDSESKDSQKGQEDAQDTENAGQGSSYDSSAPEDDTAIHRYEYIVSDCTWQEAFQECLDKGGDLVRINSMKEYEHIRKEISSQKMTNIFFRIGARRDSGSQDYYLVNEKNKLFGEKLNSADSWCLDEWGTNEPSFTDGDLEELYVDIYFSNTEKRFVWNDIPDNILEAEPAYAGLTGYICEYAQ